ncbi:MAG: stage II sporulation protein M [Nanoarchaeota archaeon]|nr:stage II sporulation protein M [Nanoarchaeota archaeon]MBU1028286.1 stage II sporulation protein M [Nanoarchaeota archaeon]
MLESLINPKRAEKGPWKMFFIGLVYASLSLLLVHWFFAGDPVLSKFSGIIVVTFAVMFSLPFMYYMIKQEEEEDEQVEGFFSVWKIHSDALYGFMWLFLGFIIAFAFWHPILNNNELFNAQIKTYCMINSPGNIEDCFVRYSPTEKITSTGAATHGKRFFSIIENNVYVMIFTLVFSLLFGAGAIFVLAWNASVISAAIGIFTKYQLTQIPLGIARYMIHGFPEIAAYFVTALAGGIFGVGILKNGIKSPQFLRVLENTIILLFVAIVLLLLAATIEVYITPLIFN